MKTKEQLIEECLNNFRFDLLYDFYTKVLGYAIFPAPWECPVHCSVSWMGKEITIELLRETAKDVCESFFKYYEKEKGYAYLHGHGPFRVSPTKLSDDFEIQGISLGLELINSESD